VAVLQAGGQSDTCEPCLQQPAETGHVPAPGSPSARIDYLGLVQADHDEQLLGQIAYRDLPRGTSQERRS
jgi:hypothetical protein